MARYNVFESTNMKSTYYAERILDVVCSTDVENGTFGYVENTDTEDIKTFVKGYKNGCQILVADNPAWDLDMVNATTHSAVRKDKYINKSDIPFRVRVVGKGDTFATAIEGVTTDSQTLMKKGAYLTIDTATGKLVAKATSTSDAAFEAIVEKENMRGGLIETTAHKYGYARKMYQCTVKTLA